MAKGRMRSSWARTARGSGVARSGRARSTGRRRRAPHVRPPGGSSVDAGSTTWSHGVLDGPGPIASRELRHGRREVTDSLQHVGPVPGRALGGRAVRELLRRRPRRRSAGTSRAVRCIALSACVGVQPSAAASAHQRDDRATVAVWVLPSRVSAAASRVERGALPAGRVAAFPVSELGDLLRRGRRRPARSASRTRRAVPRACRRSRPAR